MKTKTKTRTRAAATTETKATTIVPVAPWTRDLARRLDLEPPALADLLAVLGEGLAHHLSRGAALTFGDDLRLSLDRGIEILRGWQAPPTGPAIYVLTKRDADFRQELCRRYANAVCVGTGVEVLKRLDRAPAAAVVFDSWVDGWHEVVRELKCDPATNRVPVIGIFPEESLDEPLRRVTIQPDTVLFAPCTAVDVARAVEDGLAAGHADVFELEMHLPGPRSDRTFACGLVEEVLFRVSLREDACRRTRQALAEALENGVRHGHGGNESYTLTVRLFADLNSVVIAVRDSGPGFAPDALHDHPVPATIGSDTLLRAALARRKRDDGKEGGIARMLGLVDMVDYNRRGNEVVLTKLRQPDPEDSGADAPDSEGRSTIRGKGVAKR